MSVFAIFSGCLVFHHYSVSYHIILEYLPYFQLLLHRRHQGMNYNILLLGYKSLQY